MLSRPPRNNHGDDAAVFVTLFIFFIALVAFIAG